MENNSPFYNPCTEVKYHLCIECDLKIYSKMEARAHEAMGHAVPKLVAAKEPQSKYVN